jgi:hypothetical protein
MIEEWRKIPNYDEYEVSNLGRVRSLRRNIIMSQRPDRYGYKYVNLYSNGRKTFKVHQLVAMSFLNHIPCGLEIVVDHINNVKDDNRLVNLQLISCKANNQKDKKNLGISYHKLQRRYIVRVEGRYIGGFKTEEEAKNSLIDL